ncbi:MAG: hypothetical protein ABIO51_01040 [Solirubrobacteraceae bacterium]
MRRTAALIAFACLSFAPSAGAALSVPAGFFGMTVDGALFRADLGQRKQFGLMTRVGVESVITEVNWNFLQPQEDVAPDFTRTDRVVLNAARRGMRIMANVVYAPPWAATDPSSAASPPEPTKYAIFLRALIQRYGPEGSFWGEHPGLTPRPIRDWQVWNEPPSKGFWSEQPFQKEYVELLKAARFGVKVTDPGARVVLAGLTFRSWEDIAKIYKAGGQGLFDAVSLHPYTRDPADVKTIIKLVREQMGRNGDGKLPVLITELSWPSAKGKSKDDYGYEVTPAQQAVKLRRVLPLLAEARKRLRIERVYWHSWLSIDRGRFSFDYSGLRTIAGSEIRDKPALAAYRKGVLALEGCRRKGATVKRCG